MMGGYMCCGCCGDVVACVCRRGSKLVLGMKMATAALCGKLCWLKNYVSVVHSEKVQCFCWPYCQKVQRGGSWHYCYSFAFKSLEFLFVFCVYCQIMICCGQYSNEKGSFIGVNQMILQLLNHLVYMWMPQKLQNMENFECFVTLEILCDVI